MQEEFICPICGKILKNKNVFNSHKTFHENQKKYPSGVFCPMCNHKSSSFVGFVRHVSMFHKEEIEGVYRKFYNDENDHVCEYCKKEKTTVKKFSKGFEKYCDNCKEKAHKENHKKAMENVDYSKYDFSSRNKKSIKTSLEIYGTTNPAKSEIVKEKARKTCQERYNANGPMGNEKVKQKAKITNLKKTGCEWHTSSESTKNTRKENLLEKYGVDNVFKLESTKDEIVNTMISKYGVKNGFQTEKSKIGKSKHFLKNFLKTKTKYAKPLFSEEDWFNRKENPNLLFECNVCKKNFEFNVLSWLKPRCFECMPKIKKFQSNGEREIQFLLSKNNINFEENNRNVLGKRLELDIFIPSKNLAIEYNGVYWHSEARGVDEDYHLFKTERCKQLNIKLLHIFETEWKNKQSIVESIILSNLNIYKYTIHGRKCVVKQVDSKTANKFYEENHIQGKSIFNLSFGLFHNDELVSCISFSKPRFNKKYDWELIRYANKLNTKVHGGFGKLWKYKPIGKIICYSDKRLFSGNVYEKYMTKLNDSKPSYFYVIDGELKNRVNFQKHKLKDILPIFDEKLTEVENMKANGFYRIWDCGNYVFEYVN